MQALLRIEETPEEIELAKKQKLLQKLQNRLAEKEESLLEFQTQLKEFEIRYINEVGKYYADLDEIEAQIAEEELKLVPDDEEIRRRAEALRERAAASCHAAEEAQYCTHKFNPSSRVKTQYRNLARQVHPDLATDENDRQLRHKLMAEANRAYEEGNEDAIVKLMETWKISPETVKGADIGADLIRLIRQLAQVRRRLNDLHTEVMCLSESENNLLRLKVTEEMLEGRNLLKQQAERAKAHIRKAERRLKELRENTAAISEFQTFQVKTDWNKLYDEIDREKGKQDDERYGLNISMFQ